MAITLLQIRISLSLGHPGLNDYILQVAALAPLALLLVLEARCASIILCCGVVHHYSYTAHIQTCE